MFFSGKTAKEYLVLAAVLIALLLVSFYDVAFLGKTFKASTANTQSMHYGVYGQEHNRPRFIPVNGTDSPVQEEPIYNFLKDNLKQGILPLWNPHQALGFPLIAAIEIGMFFPLTLIMYLLPEFYAWDVLIFSRFFFAGLLTYWFMRTLRFRKPVALASGIIFMLSGPMILLQYWTANVDILLPLLLLCIERLLQKPGGRSAAYTAIAVGLTFLAGHPEHIFFVNVYGFLYFCFRFLSLRKLKEIVPVSIALSGAYLLGIGLAALVFWPFISNFNSEFWHGHPPLVGLHNEEMRSRIITLLVPFFFQKETLTYDFTFSGWWGGYLGTLPLWLACIGLFRRQRKGLNYFFWILGFLIVSKAYSYPFINWVGYLPIFNLCRYAIHTPHLVAFSTAIAAGMGLRLILAQKNVLLKSLSVAAIGTGLVLFNLWQRRGSDNFPIALEATVFFLVILAILYGLLFLRFKGLLKAKYFTGLLLLFIFLELFSYIHRERPQRFASFPPVPYMEFLRSQPERVRAFGYFWVFYPNTASAYGVDDLGIFFGMIPARYVEFVNTLLKPGNFADDLRPPALRAMPFGDQASLFLDILNVRYIVVPPTEFLSKMIPAYAQMAAATSFVYEEEVNILERPGAFPRAYIVHKAIFNPNIQEGFAFMYRTQANISEYALINDSVRPEFLALKYTPVRDNSAAKITRYTPNEVIVEAVMESPGFLVLSDAYHPDWKAHVNGKPAKIYLTNGLVRSVFLPAGKHAVRFVFRPLSFYGGLGISILSMLIILFLVGVNKDKPLKLRSRQ